MLGPFRIIPMALYQSSPRLSREVEPTFAGLWHEVVLDTVPFLSLHLLLSFPFS